MKPWQLESGVVWRLAHSGREDTRMKSFHRDMGINLSVPTSTANIEDSTSERGQNSNRPLQTSHDKWDVYSIESNLRSLLLSPEMEGHRKKHSAKVECHAGTFSLHSLLDHSGPKTPLCLPSFPCLTPGSRTHPSVRTSTNNWRASCS